MNELQIFKNNEFGEVRTLEINGKPYFMASDVAKALGYLRPNNAVAVHCRATVKQGIPISGKLQDANFIPEGDVYRLVVKSQLPSAEKFESWVFDEVLPSIRSNGGYLSNQEEMTPEQIVANALLVAQKIIEAKTAQIEELKPKAAFFDAVADSKTAVSMNDVAKVLELPNIGRNKLFELLRNQKILDSDNKPYQKYIDMGYFRLIEQKYSKNGETCINFKTLVYQKGIEFIRRSLK